MAKCKILAYSTGARRLLARRLFKVAQNTPGVEMGPTFGDADRPVSGANIEPCRGHLLLGNSSEIVHRAGRPDEQPALSPKPAQAGFLAEELKGQRVFVGFGLSARPVNKGKLDEE